MCLIIFGPWILFGKLQDFYNVMEEWENMTEDVFRWLLMYNFNRLKKFGRFTASCGRVDKMHSTFLQCPHFSSSWRSFLRVIALHLSSHVSCLRLFSYYQIRQNAQKKKVFISAITALIQLINIGRSFFKIKQTKPLSQRPYDTWRHPSPPLIHYLLEQQDIDENLSRKKQTETILCSLVSGRRYMYQVIRNTTFYTITPAVTVAMGMTDWDFMPLIVWIVHFAWVHEAESWFGGVFMCAVTQQLPPSGRGCVVVRLVCETWNCFCPSS